MKREDDTSEVELAGGGEAVWHVAVAEGQSQGPYTAGELSGLRAGGTIQDSMLVWRSGWPDWRPLGKVGEIIDAPPLELTTAGAASEGANGFDVSVSMGDDPFASDSVPPGPAATLAGYAAPRPVRAAPASGGAHEAPVSMGADPFSTGESPAATPRVSAADAMTPGQNREGTVEINLAEFRRLSMTTTAQPTGLTEAKTGGREDSGLIDVRKVAESGEAVAAAGRGSYEVIGIPTGSGLEALRKPWDFRMKLIASVGALAGVLFFVVLGVALFRDRPEELAAAAPDGTSPELAAAAPSAPVAPAPAPMADEKKPAEPAGEKAADEGERAAAEEEEDPSSDRTSSKRRRRSSRAQRSTASEPREPAPAKASGGNSIDDLIGRALEGGGKTASKPAADTSSLANTPSRDQVVTAMNGVKNKVGACGDSGVATVKTVVSGSTGRVTSASATGITGSAKACVERAVKSARFPKFKQPSFTVSYPFRL